MSFRHRHCHAAAHVALALAAGALLAACSDDPTAPPAERLTLRPGALQLYIDDTVRVLAEALDAEGALARVGAMAWYSTDTTVAAVDSLGRVHGVRPGSARIGVRAGELEAEAGVSVVGFQSINAGANFTCGILTDGRLVCWGVNERGRNGTGIPAASPLPTAVAVPSPVRSVSAGGEHGCALTTNGELWCWGRNLEAQLGLGSAQPADSPAPVRVADVPELREIEVGHHDFTCGLTADSVAVCWGHNDTGQLGRGTVTRAESTVVAVPGAPKFASLSASAYFHACGLTSGGEAWCWGRPWAFGDTSSVMLGAVRAIPDSRFRALTAEGRNVGRTCGIVESGGALCVRHTPSTPGYREPLPGSANLTSISASGSESYVVCGLTGDGEVLCWPNPTAEPTRPAPGLEVATIDVGFFHACGVTTRGGAYCWGSGYLGDGGAARTSATAIRVARPF